MPLADIIAGSLNVTPQELSHFVVIDYKKIGEVSMMNIKYQ